MYMYKKDLTLNNLQWLICQKTQPNQIIFKYMYKKDLALIIYKGRYPIKPNQPTQTKQPIKLKWPVCKQNIACGHPTQSVIRLGKRGVSWV